jgi:hypothetical protein
VVGEEDADEPEEDIDVEEEEDVGEEERVLGAPRGERAGIGIGIGIAAVADEGEVEEDGRERDEEGDDQVFEAAAGHGDQSFLVRGERQCS